MKNGDVLLFKCDVHVSLYDDEIHVFNSPLPSNLITQNEKMIFIQIS